MNSLSCSRLRTFVRLLLLSAFLVLGITPAFAHYSPRLGRWLSRDPIGEEGGFNLYAYCGNDPVNRHDPTGLKDFTRADGSIDSTQVHSLLDFVDLMATDFPFAVYTGLAGLPGQVNQGMAQARADINAQTDSGKYGLGTAVMARGLQFMATASAGITMAPLQPVDTAVGVGSAPVVLPYSLGSSMWEFGSDPSLSKGLDVFENGVNVAAMFQGGAALQNRVPALQNLRAPSMPRLNPANYDWNPVFAPYRGGYAYSGVPLPGLPRYAGPPANPTVYSVAFEMQLDPANFGQRQQRHFQIANQALERARASNPGLAGLVPAPVGWGRPPPGWTWQHATLDQGGIWINSQHVGRRGVMQLVPRSQHTPGSPWWRLFHPLPGAAGGYSQWAVPAGAPQRN